MDLIEYDDSNDEEFRQVQNIQFNGSCNNYLEFNITTNQNQSLFSSPPPDEDQQDKEVDELLVKKPNKRIQINIPSLTDYNEEIEGPADKRTKKSVLGLFAVLPPPKITPLSNTSFVPNIVLKRANKTLSKSQPSKTNSLKRPLEPINLQYECHSNSCDIETSETFDDETWQKTFGKKKKNESNEPLESTTTLAPRNVNVVAAPEVEKPYSGFDNKAFRELMYSSSQRIPHKIKLIDLHEDVIRPDKSVWLKSLTDPYFEAEPYIENNVDNTRKSTNHITALAQKALANNKELQMRWSENRFKRKQTQAKYGF